MSCSGKMYKSFGRKVNPDAKKAMALVHSEGVTLKEAWAIVKSRRAGKSGKRTSKARTSKKHRMIRRATNSLKLNRKRMVRKTKKRTTRKSRKTSKRRGFGKTMGPGYNGQTSYSNAYAPYFGNAEPFVNASNWWYPYAGNQMQSPQMLMKNA